MSVINTKRNFVVALDPIEGDTHVETWIRGSERTHLFVQPIANYHAAVAWAVSMADFMEHRIDIVPISANEYRKRHGGRAEG